MAHLHGQVIIQDRLPDMTFINILTDPE